MVGNDSLFIDLDKGRVGTFVNSELRADQLIVRYVPFGRFFPVEIGGLRRNSLLPPIEREWEKKPGNAQLTYILVRGEGGSSEILEKHLNNRVPDLLNQLAELERRDGIRQAAWNTASRIYERGAESILKDQVRRRKMVDAPAAQIDDKKKRRFFGGNDYGE